MKYFAMENFSKEHTKQFFKILQYVSPVRVNSVILVDPPKWFNSIWKIFGDFSTKDFLQKFELTTRSKLYQFAEKDS